jgi:hypothetical protein
MDNTNTVEQELSQGQTSLSQGQTSLSKKQIWYNLRKTDENYLARIRDSRRKYYEKNRLQENDKSLDRYYARMAKKLLIE